jgi:hypothetical protein
MSAVAIELLAFYSLLSGKPVAQEEVVDPLHFIDKRRVKYWNAW